MTAVLYALTVLLYGTLALIAWARHGGLGARAPAGATATGGQSPGVTVLVPPPSEAADIVPGWRR